MSDMTEEQVRNLFSQVDVVLDCLKAAFLEALGQGIENGFLNRSVGQARGELRWPYSYGERKLELNLEIRAGIPREEES